MRYEVDKVDPSYMPLWIALVVVAIAIAFAVWSIVWHYDSGLHMIPTICLVPSVVIASFVIAVNSQIDEMDNRLQQELKQKHGITLVGEKDEHDWVSYTTKDNYLHRGILTETEDGSKYVIIEVNK